MPATELNITIEQGANFSQTVSVGDAHNGKACRAAIYDTFGGRLLATFACTEVDEGESTISLTAAEAEGIMAPVNARADAREVPIGVWDLEAVDGSDVARTHLGVVRLKRLGRIR